MIRAGRTPAARAAAAGRTPAAGRLRRRAVAAALPAAAALLAATASPAEAVGYRYWSFWQTDGDAWAYARQGPSVSRPLDGSVEGWRFSVSEDSSEKAARPRGDRDFAEICADTPAEKGTKRIALVLDFGTADDAPGGETPPRPRTACARVPEGATSAEALAEVAAPLRYGSDGLLCAIDGFPASGCGEAVAGDGRKDTGEDTDGADAGGDAPGASSGNGNGNGGGDGNGDGGRDGGPSVGVLAGVGAVVLLGAAAAWQARRRS
ncbi:SCO2322 family protein [Streptomyces sp. HB2AG]|uniref:SCO2322 family protein n=1 Tax=Streptomyces sp. HB2AG TaxID=2983400 RepID=UPI003FA763E9